MQGRKKSETGRASINLPHVTGQNGPTVGLLWCQTRLGRWSGDRRGSCFPSMRMKSTSHGEEIPTQTCPEKHYLCAVSGPAPGSLLRGQWGSRPAALDSSGGPGARCKVTLWRRKPLVMPRVAQIKVKYHIQSSRGVFAIKLSLENK